MTTSDARTSHFVTNLSVGGGWDAPSMCSCGMRGTTADVFDHALAHGTAQLYAAAVADPTSSPELVSQAKALATEAARNG